uniref:glutathione-specific gamma-glutamylcyclotransferase n=1 Tax=Kwoniella bestiolae CBS 10118 TaxID=1296100 RepID=A0A1B9GD80_9TREE|nr:hypothetical protein I302_00466 [Kwoniella bestiolae CBS 10118]OCF28975.1 hypothetical protein I302_00466 [Kwoniella bestiolae CBS 10118]
MVYWVFGYGSLIFKPPPHAVEHRSGYVKGVVRRFAQSSVDHRGTHEAPGRVVTVIEAREWHKLEGITIPEGTILPEDYVWGMAYRIDPEYEEEVKAYMEHREKNGYTCHFVPVYTTSPAGDEESIAVESDLLAHSRLIVGFEPVNELAKTISERHGPSGPNKEYLYKLAESVRHLYPHVRDDYLFRLEATVKALEPRD